MEKQNRTYALSASLSDSALWTGFFAAVYLAVLPMADTIALRNVALLALLVCLAWQFSRIRPSFRLGLPILLWMAYLLIFPAIATDHGVALRSLEGQWGRGILAMLAGAGTALVLRDRNTGTSFHFGLASAWTLLVFLSLVAWKALQTGQIPWGYWGRESHHADLGYAAGQTVVLLTATLLAGQKRYRPWALLLVACALISPALAYSRAGLAFAILGGLLVFLAVVLTQAGTTRRYVLAGMAVLLLASLAVIGVAVKVDPRWQEMTVKFAAGFLGDPIQIECKGTASIEAEIAERYGPPERAQRVIMAVRDGDGARMVILRAGLELAYKHPWGLDGSRQSFQKLLRQECAAPVLDMAHAHNGWVDTALAIGWAGALLYLWVLLYFCVQGFIRLRSHFELNEWALLLIALSIFWILRAWTDSVFRDHMFEMQGFVLAYALLQVRRGDGSTGPKGAAG